MYEQLEQWLNDALSQQLPLGIAGFNFNLYDDGDNDWSLELVGCDRFDKNDADWACEEIFDTRDETFTWNEAVSQEEILAECRLMLMLYLENGKYADKRKAADGLGIGFVDDDLELLYAK